MDNVQINALLTAAEDIALQNFCCKYSGFTVGAALLSADGQIFTGFNIENDGIQSICAERCAFTKALTAGVKDFIAIAVVGKRLSEPHFHKTLPCGYCRQFMSEYASPDLLIITRENRSAEISKYKLSDLLPEAFGDF